MLRSKAFDDTDLDVRSGLRVTGTASLTSVKNGLYDKTVFIHSHPRGTHWRLSRLTISKIFCYVVIAYFVSRIWGVESLRWGSVYRFFLKSYTQSSLFMFLQYRRDKYYSFLIFIGFTVPLFLTVPFQFTHIRVLPYKVSLLLLFNFDVFTGPT